MIRDAYRPRTAFRLDRASQRSRGWHPDVVPENLFVDMKAADGTPSPFLPNLLAGLTSGLVTLVYSISFAALIFSGELTPFFPQGVGTALVGATVTAILVAWRSPFPFTLAGPEANSAILLALAGTSIASALIAAGRPSAVYPTVWAAILLSTAATGLFLYLLGRFRLGHLARYIPYPVIGGFLAGTGWLITRSSFKVMTGIPLGFSELPALMHGESAVQWIAGAVWAGVLSLVLSRSRHVLTLPGLLLVGIVSGNAAGRLAGRLHINWTPEGWFFQPFSQERIWEAWNLSTISQVDWTVLAQQGGTLLALLVIVMLSILLNSTGLELATARNVDLNQELKANGVANMVNGLCGGMVGYLSINRCLLNRQAGARSPLAAMIAGVVCGSVLLLGSSFLAYIPKPVLGGLLLYIGASLLIRWAWQSWSQLPRSDYLLVIVILAIIATFGFLQGVGAGILISCLLFILSYCRTSSVKYTLSGRSYRSNVSRSGPQQELLEREGDSISIQVLQGFLFFGTANALAEGIRSRVQETGRPPLGYAVFDLRLVTGLDSSAVLSFLKLRQLAGKSGLILVITHPKPSIEDQLRQGGLFTEGPAPIHSFIDLDHGIEWCEDRILEAHRHLEIPGSTLEAQLQDLLGDAEAALRLTGYFQAVELAEGQELFHQDAPPAGLYFLESGQVSVVVGLPNGKTLRRRTYTGGTILGEMGFYSNAPRSASVIADHASRLHFLSNHAFARFESEAPRLAACFHRSVVQLLAERLRRSEEEVRTLMQ